MGSEYLRQIKRLENQRDFLFTTIRNALEGYDLDWFGGKYSNSGRALDEATQKTQKIWIGETRKLTRNIPPCYEAGLGRKDYLADYDYWAKCPFFKLHEVTLLSLGLEPLAEFVDVLNPKSAQKNDPAYIFALRRHDLVKRSLDKGGFGSETRTSALAEWVNEVDLDVHLGFAQMLKNLSGFSQFERMGSKSKPVDRNAIEKEPEPREIASMSKLLTAIAISEFGYDPTDKRSPIPGEIQEIADLEGLGVSSDTIRKYLRTGAKYLPDGWKPTK